MMTVDAVARRMGWCDRTARTYVAAWFNAWEAHRGRVARGETSAAPRVPEVSKVRNGGRGRPRYDVAAASFEAFVRRSAAPANDVARARAAA